MVRGHIKGIRSPLNSLGICCILCQASVELSSTAGAPPTRAVLIRDLDVITIAEVVKTAGFRRKQRVVEKHKGENLTCPHL